MNFPGDLIVGRELSAVSFIRVYVRFEFDPPPMIDAFTRVTVSTPAGSAFLGEAEFPNLALGLIGSVVSSLTLHPGERMDIHFIGGSLISISLRVMGSFGPEAVLVHGLAGGLLVI